MTELFRSDNESLVQVFFPLASEVRDSFQEYYEADPDFSDSLLDEMEFMHPNFSQACEYLIKGWGADEGVRDGFVRGCTLVYQLFLMQASYRGASLPDLDIEITEGYMQRLAGCGLSPEDYYNRQAADIEARNEEFSRAVEEYLITADLPELQRQACVFACVATYDLLQQQFEDRDLQQAFAM